MVCRSDFWSVRSGCRRGAAGRIVKGDQFLSKSFTGPGEPTPDGPKGNRQAFRYFLVRQIIELSESQDLPMSAFDFRERPLQQGNPLQLFHRKLRLRPLGRRRRRTGAARFKADFVARSSTTAGTGVQRNPINPGIKLTLVLKVGQVDERFDEGFLDNFFGIMLATDVRADCRQKAIFVPLDELHKGFFFAMEHPFDQILFVRSI